MASSSSATYIVLLAILAPVLVQACPDRPNLAADDDYYEQYTSGRQLRYGEVNNENIQQLTNLIAYRTLNLRITVSTDPSVILRIKRAVSSVSSACMPRNWTVQNTFDCNVTGSNIPFYTITSTSGYFVVNEYRTDDVYTVYEIKFAATVNSSKSGNLRRVKISEIESLAITSASKPRSISWNAATIKQEVESAFKSALLNTQLTF